MKDSALSNVLGSVGSLPESTTKSAIKRAANGKLFASLDSHPLHAYSPTGRRNICSRFGLTDAELENILLSYERPGELSEAERRAADLAHALRVIEEAVTPKRKAAPKGRQKGGVKW